MKRTLRDRAITVALTAFIIAALVVLSGCATKPLCPVATVRPIIDRTGAIWFLIDETNTRVIQARFQGVRDGECESGENWAEVPKGDL